MDAFSTKFECSLFRAGRLLRASRSRFPTCLELPIAFLPVCLQHPFLPTHLALTPGHLPTVYLKFTKLTLGPWNTCNLNWQPTSWPLSLCLGLGLYHQWKWFAVNSRPPASSTVQCILQVFYHLIYRLIRGRHMSIWLWNGKHNTFIVVSLLAA